MNNVKRNTEIFNNMYVTSDICPRCGKKCGMAKVIMYHAYVVFGDGCN